MRNPQRWADWPLPGWAATTIQQDSFDFAPPRGEAYRLPEPKTTKELLELFAKSRREARAAIAGASDEHLMKQWTLFGGGKEIFRVPRTAVLRHFFMNHLIHHRAQLGVYLRLNNIPVPATYGPSADEEVMFGASA